MGYLFVVLGKALHQAEGMLTRRYSKKYGESGFFFNGVICLFAMVFFFLTDPGGLAFPGELFAYGALNMFAIAAGFYGMYRALRLGSFMLTTMISGFSGVLVLLYALLYLKEPANAYRYAAILLSVLSVAIVNLGKKDTKKTAFSLKWLLWTLVCLVSNGMIGILNRQQQIAFHAQCDNEFMILSFGGAALLLILLALLRERDKLRSAVSWGFFYGAAIGSVNGGGNLCNLLSYRYLPITVVSPVGTGLSLVFSFLISVFIYKEKFTKYQLTGTLLGVAALLLMTMG